MGYFSNGTEGMMYEEQYCSECIHGQGNDVDDGEACPVWMLHFQHNYDEGNKPDSILHVLIPFKDGRNGECRMFVQRPAPKYLPNQQEFPHFGGYQGD